MHDLSTDPTRRNQCRHIHTRGTRCGSPALRGHDFCFYHDRSRREAPDAHGYHGSFKMPRIDDRDAVQLALFEVLSRIAARDIDYQQARLLLSGLRIAAANLPRPTARAADDRPDVHEVTFDPLLQEDLAPVAEFSEQSAEIPPLNRPAEPSEEPASTTVPDPTVSIRIPTEDWVDSPAMRYVTTTAPQPVTLAAVHATVTPPRTRIDNIHFKGLLLPRISRPTPLRRTGLEARQWKRS